MALQIDDSLDLGQQKNIDARYDNDGQGWTSVSQVMSGVPLGKRALGLQVLINNVVYWWSPTGSLTDNPVIKDNPADIVRDGLISGGAIDISAFGSGNISVAPAQWILTISSVQAPYSTSTTTTFTGIGLSTSGNQRYVAFYGTGSNTIIKVEGAQSPAAVMPSTPPNTVLLGYVLITSSAAQPPVVDLSGYAKLNDNNTFTQNNEFKKTPTVNGVNVATVNDVPTVPIASSSEINTGTDNTKFITPLGLEGSKYLDRFFARISATTTGTSTVYVASLTPALTAYVTNQPVVLTFNVNSGASPTVNFNSLGAKNLVRMDGTAIQSGDLVTGVKYLFIYDGTSFRMATPIINEVIRNQTASQTANYYISGNGRIDTGLGLGLAANAAAFLAIAASTASKGNILLTASSTAYTGTTSGMLSYVLGILNLYDGTGNTPLLKKDRNTSLSGTGSALLIVDGSGNIARGASIDEGFETDPNVISALTSASYVSGYATISPSTGAFLQGDEYFDSSTKYWYRAVADNQVIRVIPS